MDRRNFLIKLLLWILTFIFGHRAMHAIEMEIQGSDSTMIKDKDGRLVSEKSEILNEELAEIKYELALKKEVRINVKEKRFGAIGDGLSHPLSDFFPTLKLAQLKYPHATSLTNEIDWVGFKLQLITLLV